LAGDIPKATRRRVAERDDGCLRCGKTATDIHHRQRRAVGGHSEWNLVSLCRTCHTEVHSDPEESRRRGWIISSYEQNPQAVPVEAWYGTTQLGE
jgi:5-methylcytosine-specific restriction endonuclease McrA